MREIRSYGSVGVSAGNRRHYPAENEDQSFDRRWETEILSRKEAHNAQKGN